MTATDLSEDEIECIIREGGGALNTYLLSKAIWLDIRIADPSKKPICKWTYRDIHKLPADETAKWKVICCEQLEMLDKHEVFELVDHPKDHKVIKNHWIFDVKSNGCKWAHLVAKGFSQVEGLDFNQIFSSVVCYKTVCLILALAILENWHMKAINVWSTYLYGKLNKEIFMEQPEGFKIPSSENKVLHLKKALYSLKQASLAWWNALNDSMKELGFEQIKSDPGIFLYKRNGSLTVVAIVYVDNSIFCGPSKAIVDEIKGHFMRKWKCQDLGEATKFLHMHIKRHGHKINIDQCAYLDKVIECFGLQNANSTPTPLPQGYYPICNDGPLNPPLCTKFQTIIGSLLYIMIGTWPDIAYTVTALLKHSANSTKEYVSKVLYIYCYLLGTPNAVLHFNGNQDQGIIASTNADWASNPNNYKFQTGWFLKLAGCTFSWCSHQQPTVAHSSMEAEYISLSDYGRQAFWICQLLDELGYKLGPISICKDNQGSIFMASNAITEQCSKPIVTTQQITQRVQFSMLDAKSLCGKGVEVKGRSTLSCLSLLVRGINKKTQIEFLADLCSLKY